MRLELLDADGLVIAASGSSARMRPLEGLQATAASQATGVVTLRSADDRQRAAIRATNGGRWRIIAHQSETLAFARLHRIQLVIIAFGLLLFVFIVAAMLFLNAFVARRVSEPASALATAAEQVASGDLSVTVYASAETDEVGRLSRAVDTMVE